MIRVVFKAQDCMSIVIGKSYKLLSQAEHRSKVNSMLIPPSQPCSIPSDVFTTSIRCINSTLFVMHSCNKTQPIENRKFFRLTNALRRFSETWERGKRRESFISPRCCKCRLLHHKVKISFHRERQRNVKKTSFPSTALKCRTGQMAEMSFSFFYRDAALRICREEHKKKRE